MRDAQNEPGLYCELAMPPSAAPEPEHLTVRAATILAGREAMRTGRGYMVATSRRPMTVHVFAADHPSLPCVGMTVVHVVAPDGRTIRPS
jgi:hypothetical protein